MSHVRLILREEVPGLGDAGDVVNAKPGYARNFLLPKGKATLATEARVKQLEHEKRVIAEKLAKDLKDLRAARDRFEGQHLEVTAQAGEEGKLFGSVTAPQIAELLAEKGLEVDRRKIVLSEPIKTVGEHQVTVRLHREVQATVKLTVTAVGAPAEPEPTEAEAAE
ncbi:MAG: 50S ribosomal protein L9 [Proteobacteria bacterium]|nr:50S ribosomal protein L9 [Pseudomonadota bacterium]